MKKKIFSLLLVMMMSISMLVGCSKSESITVDNEKINIVCSIYPIYDWVKEIIGQDNEKFNVTLLMDSGLDYHSYKPSADELISISNADLFLYVGGESDSWVNEVVESSVKGKVIKLLDTLGEYAKEEEVVEGMNEESHEHEEHESNTEEIEYDEHIWLSLKNAKIILEEIKNDICELDVENKDIYESNSSKYNNKLSELDARYEEAVSNSKVKTILFADRFPFRYLVDDYGLEYYAAFTGCSTETEASFETVIFLANKLDELEINNVITIEGTDNTLAQTVISNTKNKDQNIIEMNSMQSININDIENGISYINVMERNLDALKLALN